MRKISGAAESNAGDEFHVLWAARRCLDLLRTSTGLSSVMIESISEEDQIGLQEEKLLSVDLTEYFVHGTPLVIGKAASFCDANKVVVSQLKYSTRHPDVHWTAARLCSESGKEDPHSIISRLSDTFSQLCGKYAKLEVQKN